MSLTSRKFILLKRLIAKVVFRASDVVFVLALLVLPFLYRFKYNTSVQEHGYLNRYSMNELVQDDFNLMYKTQKQLLEENVNEYSRLDKHGKKNHYDYYKFKNNYTDYQQHFKKKKEGSAYSYWSDERFEDTPEVFVKLSKTLKESRNVQVSFNRYKYTFPTNGRNSEVYGHNLLFRLNCLRCLARGATLLVATVNTDNYKEDIHSVLLGVTAMRHFADAQYLSQNIFLLVTMRQVPFAVGTRQFLHDYFNSHYFKHRSGTIHNALVVDLGSNQCMSYLISYEGIDGMLPNQDIVNIFVEISEVEGAPLSTRGMWQSIFRMAVNVDRGRHHVPLLEKNINAFSVLCKSSSKVEKNVRYNLELLLKSLVLTMRNQNNLHTVLERSFNFYYFVKPTSFVSISVYSLVVPLLFIRQFVWMVFYSFFGNLKMLFGVLLVLFNIFLGSLPTYLFLQHVVRENSGSLVDETLLEEVRVSVEILFLTYLVVLGVNFLVYMNFKHLFGDDYFQEQYMSREEIMYEVKKVKKKFSPKLSLRFSLFYKRFRRVKFSTRFVNFFKKFFKSLWRAVKIVLAQRYKFKFKPEKPEEKPKTDGDDTELSDAELLKIKDPQYFKAMDEFRLLCGSMGPYTYLSRVPEKLPRVDLFLLFSIYFLVVSFALGLSVLNWALCFLLTLVLLVPFNVVGLHKLSRTKNVLVLLYYMVLTLLLYPFKGFLGVFRQLVFKYLKAGFGFLEDFFELEFFRRYDFFTEVADKFAFLKDFVFGSKTNWINSRGDNFLLRKIYSASENHLLFGSYNIVILLFMFGVLSHMLFLNVVLLFLRRPKTKTD